MKTTESIYTLGIVGEKASHLNDFTYVLMQALEKRGNVVSGDYLDKKKLAGRNDAFHVGFYGDRLLVDVINCPLNLANFSLTSTQAHQLLWVLAPETTTDNLRNAVAIAAELKIQDHIVILNIATLDQGLRDDDEVLDLLEMETFDLFSEYGLQPRRIICLGVEQYELLSGNEEELDTIVYEVITGFPQLQISSEGFMMQVERCYNLKEPGGNIARVAFGPVHSGEIEVGSNVMLVGFEDEPVEGRITDIELFGNPQNVALAGASVSMKLRSLPKDLPKPGQFVTRDLTNLDCSEELLVEVKSINPVTSIFAGLRGIDLCAGAAITPATIENFKPDTGSVTSALIRVEAQKKLPFLKNQLVLLGNSGEILAWGNVRKV